MSLCTRPPTGDLSHGRPQDPELYGSSGSSALCPDPYPLQTRLCSKWQGQRDMSCHQVMCPQACYMQGHLSLSNIKAQPGVGKDPLLSHRCLIMSLIPVKSSGNQDRWKRPPWMSLCPQSSSGTSLVTCSSEVSDLSTPLNGGSTCETSALENSTPGKHLCPVALVLKLTSTTGLQVHL